MRSPLAVSLACLHSPHDALILYWHFHDNFDNPEREQRGLALEWFAANTPLN